MAQAGPPSTLSRVRRGKCLQALRDDAVMFARGDRGDIDLKGLVLAIDECEKAYFTLYLRHADRSVKSDGKALTPEEWAEYYVLRYIKAALDFTKTEGPGAVAFPMFDRNAYPPADWSEDESILGYIKRVVEVMFVLVWLEQHVVKYPNELPVSHAARLWLSHYSKARGKDVDAAQHEKDRAYLRKHSLDLDNPVLLAGKMYAEFVAPSDDDGEAAKAAFQAQLDTIMVHVTLLSHAWLSTVWVSKLRQHRHAAETTAGGSGGGGGSSEGASDSGGAVGGDKPITHWVSDGEKHVIDKELLQVLQAGFQDIAMELITTLARWSVEYDEEAGTTHLVEVKSFM